MITLVSFYGVVLPHYALVVIQMTLVNVLGFLSVFPVQMYY